MDVVYDIQMKHDLIFSGNLLFNSVVMIWMPSFEEGGGGGGNPGMYKLSHAK